jgi:hypothetical protein
MVTDGTAFAEALHIPIDKGGIDEDANKGSGSIGSRWFLVDPSD